MFIFFSVESYSLAPSRALGIGGFKGLPLLYSLCVFTWTETANIYRVLRSLRARHWAKLSTPQADEDQSQTALWQF